MLLGALAAEKRGDLGSASSFLHSLLSRVPACGAIKERLALTLFNDGEYALAEGYIQELFDVEEDALRRAQYRKLLDQIWNRQPLSFSGFISLAPSTNINGGSTSSVFETDLGTFDISDESRARSGIGLTLGGSAFVRTPLTGQVRHLATLGISANLYEDSDFNSATVSGKSSFLWRTSADSEFSLGPSARYRIYTSSENQTSVGVHAGYSIAPRPSHFVRLGAHVQYHDYEGASQRNGPQATVSAQYSYAVDAASVVTARADATALESGLDYQSYLGSGVSLEFRKDWRVGLTTQLGGRFTYRAYRADFPFLNEPRRDQQYQINASVRFNSHAYRGFVPQVGCSYSINVSNVSLYDNSNGSCSLNAINRF